MTVNVKAYLPGYETITLYFLKGKCEQLPNDVCADLMSGKKKFIKCDAVKNIYVPQYEGLSVERMMQEASQSPDLMHYLPDSKRLPTCRGSTLQTSSTQYSASSSPTGSSER